MPHFDNPSNARAAAMKGRAGAQARQAQHDAEVGPAILALWHAGLSWRKIAAELTAQGVRPPRDAWTDIAVRRIFKRIAG